MTDWVKERSECSPALVFERLKHDIQGDVDSRNAIIPSGLSYKFRADMNGNRVIVLLDGLKGNHSLGLVLEGQKFSATASENDQIRPMFTSTLTLDENRNCKFKIDGVEHECWRFRQKFLEDLFFNII